MRSQWHHTDFLELYNNSHTIIGTVVVLMMLLQPLIGLIQHLRYRETRKRSAWNLLHQWYGRVLILLAMINGGLGLQLANNTTGGKIAYSVVAGISGTSFIGLIVWSEMRRRKERNEGPSDIALGQVNQGEVKATNA